MVRQLWSWDTFRPFFAGAVGAAVVIFCVILLVPALRGLVLVNDSDVWIHSFWCDPVDASANETYVRLVTRPFVYSVGVSEYGVCHPYDIKPGIVVLGGEPS